MLAPSIEEPSLDASSRGLCLETASQPQDQNMRKRRLLCFIVFVISNKVPSFEHLHKRRTWIIMGIQPTFTESQPTFTESQPTFAESQPTFTESQPAFTESGGVV